jgi:hypothetical protein
MIPGRNSMARAETQLKGTGTMHVCSKAMQQSGNLEICFFSIFQIDFLDINLFLFS